MLICSRCDNEPIQQCKSCNLLLLCKDCLSEHIVFHSEYKTNYVFGPISIKFPVERMIKLKNCIAKHLKAIQKQKNDIKVYAQGFIAQIQKMVSEANYYLDSLIEECNIISQTDGIFSMETYKKAEEILNETLVFEPPTFSKLDCSLTKSQKISKVHSKNIDSENIKAKYGFFIQGHTSSIKNLSISNNDKFIVSSSENSVQVWNSEKQILEAVFSGQTKQISSLVITNNNQFALSGSLDNTVQVWKLNENIKEYSFDVPNIEIRSMAITKDDRYLIIGGKSPENKHRNLLLWNFLLNKLECKLDGHFDQVNSIAITYDNLYAITGSGSESQPKDCTVKVWNLIKKEEEMCFQGHSSAINCVTVTTDGRFAISGSGSDIVNDKIKDNTVRVWSLSKKRNDFMLKGHTSMVTCVAVTNDNRFVVSGSSDKTVRVWNLLTKKQEGALTGQSSPVLSLGITRDNKFVVGGCNDAKMIMWNLPEKKMEMVFEGHRSKINSVTASISNQAMLSVTESEAIVWSLQNKKVLISAQKSERFLALSKDETLCLSISDNLHDMSVWSIKEKKLLTILKGHTGYITSAAIASNNAFCVSGSGEGNSKPDFTVRLWNLQERQQDFIFQGHTDRITSIVISSDNQFIASGSWDTTIRLWNVAKRIPLRIFKGHKSYIVSIAMTSDNQYIISGSGMVNDDCTVRIWSIQDKKQEIILQGHNCSVNCLSISNDNTLLISGSVDSHLIVWDLNKQEQISMFDDTYSLLLKSTIINDNQNIVLGYRDKCIKIWDLVKKKVLMKVLVSDNKDVGNFTIVSGKDSNKLFYECNGGIACLNLETKKIEPLMFFNEKLEMILKKYPEFVGLMCGKISKHSLG
ncbi:hypothetical protein SteCoe_8945 [Stentor coeruleus]|uniref:C2H2-type domain-containing protein n=1 Tax=Stentor coeruleus TaxID=5963 RepID=A0A1R2CJ12_9CILI|nr:hypothetical protein SteCoe_8945 [Stentor coeruleus]